MDGYQRVSTELDDFRSWLESLRAKSLDDQDFEKTANLIATLRLIDRWEETQRAKSRSQGTPAPAQETR